MIVFEVRSDGTVISTPSFVAQGISLSDLVVLADADYSLVTMHFTPPSGIYIPDVVFTPTLTQGRNLWQAVMPPEISRISGAVTYQIFLTSADGKTLPTPTGRITVQEGVISNMPETAEELGQYSISALYQLMSNFYASLEGYRQTLDELTVKTHKWTIIASDWTDSTPYQASIVFPHGNYAKPGTLILVAPADNRSREQIEKGELTVTVHDNGVIGDVPFVDTAVIVRGGKAPTEDINLVLFFIDTKGEDEPLTQWIGIDMGSILPEVTPEDAGKVLTVDENGDAVWKKIPDGTYLDLTFEPELYEERYEYDYGTFLGIEIALTVGKTYTVVYDGTEYECECKATSDGQYLGNGSMIGFEDTGEPFCVWLSSNFIFTTEGGEHTIKICEVEEQGGLPVFEVSSPEEITADSPDGIYLEPIEEEEEESGGSTSSGTTIHVYDSLDAAAAANLPDGSFVAVPSAKKTVLFDGKPTKMDLTSAGFGYAYLCSAEDLLTLAKGQNIHYEFEADGVKYSGVMCNLTYLSALNVPVYHGDAVEYGDGYAHSQFVYAPSLGGTGFQLSNNGGLDLGEITNLKLWTEYSENKPYYVTSYYNGTDGVFFSVDHDKVKEAVRKARLVVRMMNAGLNLVYRIPTSAQIAGTTTIYLKVLDGSTVNDITIEDGQVEVS